MKTSLTLALLVMTMLTVTVSCQMPHEPNALEVSISEEADILDLAKDDHATVCELHHVDLRIGYAPLAFGLPIGSDAQFQKIKDARFPHAGIPASQGCIAGPWKKARVKVCYQCESAYIIWKRTVQIN
jgi:hypothetical protein